MRSQYKALFYKLEKMQMELKMKKNLKRKRKSTPIPSWPMTCFVSKIEFDEAEAIYVQAYNDVRKDLRTRKRERGFVRHRGTGGGRRSRTNKKPKGRGKVERKMGVAEKMIRPSKALRQN